MDLSYNKLNGQIPRELGELSFLAIFNMSYNNLSGPTTNTWQFADFDEDNYSGNLHLYGPAVLKNCSSDLPPPPMAPAEEDESVIDMVAFNWSCGASFVTIVLVLLALLFLNLAWRKQ